MLTTSWRSISLIAVILGCVGFDFLHTCRVGGLLGWHHELNCLARGPWTAFLALFGATVLLIAILRHHLLGLALLAGYRLGWLHIQLLRHTLGR